MVSAVPPELSEPQSESDSGAPHSPQHGPHKTDHSHLGGANSQVGEPSWLSDFRAMDAPYHILLHRHVGCGKSRRTGSPVNNCRMGSRRLPEYLKAEMADHSLAGTRASLETLDSLRAPLGSAKVALARASTAFCLSRRALFFLALGEALRGESSSSRARLGARDGVEGAC